VKYFVENFLKFMYFLPFFVEKFVILAVFATFRTAQAADKAEFLSLCYH